MMICNDKTNEKLNRRLYRILSSLNQNWYQEKRNGITCMFLSHIYVSKFTQEGMHTTNVLWPQTQHIFCIIFFYHSLQ